MSGPIRKGGAARGDAEGADPGKGGSQVIMVRAKPRSPVSDLVAGSDGVWVARLRAPPVDGKANAELVALVARHFGCSRADVQVVTGSTARLKRVRIGREPGRPVR